MIELPPVAAHPNSREHPLAAVRVRRSDLGGPTLGVHALQLGAARHGSIGGHGLQRGVGDAHHRRPVEDVQCLLSGGPVHHSITRSAVPTCVPATAVAQASDMPDKDLIRAEWVAVRAPLRPAGHPLAIRGLH